jgi:putative sigma-54 modulation protein
MEVIVSARHFELGQELRSYAEAKVTELACEYTKLTTARVVMEVQRNWHLAEIHLNGKHIDLIATAQTEDMYTSLDAANDKLEKQLRKHIEKMQNHRTKETHELTEEEDDEADDLDDEEEEEVVEEA